MPLFFKQKRKSKNQKCTIDSKFNTKKTRYPSTDNQNQPKSSILINNNCKKNAGRYGTVTAVIASHNNSGSFSPFDDSLFGASGNGKITNKSNININLEFFGKEEFGKEE